MKKSRIVIAILLAVAVIVSTVSVVGFSAVTKPKTAAKQAAVQPEAAKVAGANASPRSPSQEDSPEKFQVMVRSSPCGEKSRAS